MKMKRLVVTSNKLHVIMILLTITFKLQFTSVLSLQDVAVCEVMSKRPSKTEIIPKWFILLHIYYYCLLLLMDFLIHFEECFRSVIRVGEALDVLTSVSHHCFPIVDEDEGGILLGTILRKVCHNMRLWVKIRWILYFSDKSHSIYPITLLIDPCSIPFNLLLHVGVLRRLLYL